MSLLRRGHRLLLALTRQPRIRCLRTAPVALKSSRTQNGFTGLDNCFIWDNKHGFGYDKNGNIVIVTPNDMNSTLPGLEYPQESMEIPELQNTPELQDVTLESDDDGEDYPACAGGKN